MNITTKVPTSKKNSKRRHRLINRVISRYNKVVYGVDKENGKTTVVAIRWSGSICIVMWHKRF